MESSNVRYRKTRAALIARYEAAYGDRVTGRADRVTGAAGRAEAIPESSQLVRHRGGLRGGAHIQRWTHRKQCVLCPNSCDQERSLPSINALPSRSSSTE